jgi:phosphoadenosine phosphosulfate reductase
MNDLRTTFIRKDLNWKIEFARRVIKKAIKNNPKYFVAFTGGKDSTVLLSLVKSVVGMEVPVKILHIDTTVKFPQIMKFIDKMVTLYNLELYRHTNTLALEKGLKIAQNVSECCGELKINALKQAIEKFKVEVLFVGVRWDEQYARYHERIFAKKENHIRVHPIAPFTEKDIWEYIKSFNIPYCSMYDEGYRSIGCMPCTKKDRRFERAGRENTKEEIMLNLRKIGYF